MNDAVTVRHLGMSGLRLSWPDAVVTLDPPYVVREPTVVTWTEAERVAGAAGASALAAAPEVLTWLDRDGAALRDGELTAFEGFELLPTAYTPIPYATNAEALRKTWSALRMPTLAARRLSFAVRRPPSPPLAVEIRRGGVRVVVLGQVLHRFLQPTERDRLVERYAGADMVIAGTDYDDEEATGRLLADFGARTNVIADLTGSIRRKLRLPVRPLEIALKAAPAGTLRLDPGDTLTTRTAP